MTQCIEWCCHLSKFQFCEFIYKLIDLIKFFMSSCNSTASLLLLEWSRSMAPTCGLMTKTPLLRSSLSFVLNSVFPISSATIEFLIKEYEIWFVSITSLQQSSRASLLCFLASNFPHFHRYDSLKSVLYIHAVSKNINTFPKNQGRIRAAIAVEILDFTVMYR